MGQYYVGSQMNQTYYISHHGILGQKWGVRRYQNPDGSLTEAGRKRALKSLEKDERRLEKYRTKETSKLSRKLGIERLRQQKTALEISGRKVEAERVSKVLSERNEILSKRMRELKDVTITDLDAIKAEKGRKAARIALSAAGMLIVGARGIYAKGASTPTVVTDHWNVNVDGYGGVGGGTNSYTIPAHYDSFVDAFFGVNYRRR